MNVEIPQQPKRSKKAIYISIIIAALLSFFAISYFATRPQPIDIEALDYSGEFEGENQMWVSVDLRNNGKQDVDLTIEYTTSWNGNEDYEKQDVTLPAGQTKTFSALLDSNPDPVGTTAYEVEWETR